MWRDLFRHLVLSLYQMYIYVLRNHEPVGEAVNSLGDLELLSALCFIQFCCLCFISFTCKTEIIHVAWLYSICM